MKTIKLFMAALCLCTLMACVTSEEKYENNVKKLDALITEMEKQDKISENDWAKAEALLDEMANHTEEDLKNHTEEQAEEYGRLAGRMAKLAMKQGVNTVNDAVDKVNSFIKGLSDAFGDEDDK